MGVAKNTGWFQGHHRHELFSAYLQPAMRPRCSMGVCALAAVAPLVAVLATHGSCDLDRTASTDPFSLPVDWCRSNCNVKRKHHDEALPASTTVDLVKLVNSASTGSTTVAQANYTTAIITWDYSSAESCTTHGNDGLALTPVGASGQGLGRVTLTLTLDPANDLSVSTNKVSRLALVQVAASNVVSASSHGDVTAADRRQAPATDSKDSGFAARW